MEKLTIYKNKGETFKCHFKIDGAESKDTVVRLCLEFDNNTNMFFYGELKEDGNCTIEIPRLKNLDEKRGKLTVEAIADSIYFKVYEANVELKNSVEVKMEAPIIKKAKAATNIELETILQDPKPEPSKPESDRIFEEEKPKNDDGKWKQVPWKAPKYKSQAAQEAEEPEEKSESDQPAKSPFRSFHDYIKKQKK